MNRDNPSFATVITQVTTITTILGFSFVLFIAFQSPRPASEIANDTVNNQLFAEAVISANDWVTNSRQDEETIVFTVSMDFLKLPEVTRVEYMQFVCDSAKTAAAKGVFVKFETPSRKLLKLCY